MSTKYQDSMDQGADNAARLGEDVAKRLIDHYRNNRGQNNPNNDAGDGNSAQHDAPHTDIPRDNDPTDYGSRSADFDPGTELNPNPTGGSRNMGGVNPGTDSSGGYNGSSARNGSSGAQSPSSAQSGAQGASGSASNASAGAAQGGSEAAGSGAAASGAGAGTATASASTGGAAAGSAAGGAAGGAAAGGAAAGGVAAGGAAAPAIGIGCLVVLAIFILIVLVVFVCMMCGVFTYSDESVLGAETTTAQVSTVTITGSSVNVRKGPGTQNDKVGLVYQNAQYTWLADGRANDGTIWYKIQFSASKVGWVTSQYSTKSSTGTGGNKMVELANSILLYLAEDYESTVGSAKSNVSSKTSVYGGKVQIRGANGMGGPKGESATSSRKYEYYINDGGLLASMESQDGSVEVDVPYMLAVFSVYFEKNNEFVRDNGEKVPLMEADSEEIWKRVSEILDDILSDSHSYTYTSVSYEYTVDNPNYGEVTGSYEQYDAATDTYTTIYTYDTRRTIKKTGNYYTYIIQQASIETLMYDYFSGKLDDDDWNLVESKSVFIAELLHELGGLTYASTDNYDTMVDGDGEVIIVPTGGSGIFAWPVPSCNRVSSKYGWRIHPITGVRKHHNGIDIAAGYGEQVISIADGKVIKIFKSCRHNNASACGCGGGYGNHVYVDHGNGYISRYAHLTSVKVSVGQTVTKGQVVGTVGSTGNSTGAHLHFEIRINGSHVDPQKYCKYSG